MRLRRVLIEKACFWLLCVKGAPPQAVRDCFLQPVSATPASVLRTLANPSNRCAVSEPVSATPARALRALANPCADGTKKENRGDFSSLFFYQFAALPHLFSSLFSLISYLRAAVRSASEYNADQSAAALIYYSSERFRELCSCVVRHM